MLIKLNARVQSCHPFVDVVFFAACFFLAAQYAFILSACFLLCAAVKVRVRFLAGTAAVLRARHGVEMAPFSANTSFGGRPRRLIAAPPCKTSIARVSRSRSATSSWSIWSVGIVNRLSPSSISGRQFGVSRWRNLPSNSPIAVHACLVFGIAELYKDDLQPPRVALNNPSSHDMVVLSAGSFRAIHR